MVQSSKRILRERAAAAGISDDSGCSPWLLFALIGGFTWWLAYQIGGRGLVIGGAAFVMAVSAAFVPWPAHSQPRGSRRVRCLADKRAGESICGFARSFDRRTTNTVVIRAVYERLQSWLHHPGFPVRTEDRYFDDLKLWGDDFDDMVEEVAELTARPLANMESNPYYGEVFTPGDLVCFFMHQPRLPFTNRIS